MDLRYSRQLASAAARYDHMSEPEPEISDEAFQSACEDIALQILDDCERSNRTDDLAELISVCAEVAPALAYIASTSGFPRSYNVDLREALGKFEALREQVNEQARLMKS